MNAEMRVSEGNELSAKTTERALAGLWEEVLQVPVAIDSNDNFFELGGDSIGMVTVLFRVQEEFSVELPPEAMFSAPTIRELAALIEEKLPDSDTLV